MSDSDRSSIAKLASNTRWAQVGDRVAATQPARAALERKFEDQVDPDRQLDPVERAKRVKNAKSAYYTAIARKSAKSRAARTAAKAVSRKSA